MKDIARAAGVSLSTVDRVLNQRGSTRSETAERVLKVATEIGFLQPLRPSGRRRRFDVFVPAGANSFLDRLSAAFAAVATAETGVIDLAVRRIPSFSVPDLCAALDGVEASDGVGVIALDHPQVRLSMRRLRERGIPLVTLVSDVPGTDRIGYVGVDNRAAGRLAGHLIGRFVRRAGTVAIFRGSPSYRGHEERENGCRAALAEFAPALPVVLAEETRDQIEATRLATENLLSRYPDLSAIYNVADGNPGIIAALKAAGRARDVVYIAHELSPVTRENLLDGTIDAVIDQDTRDEARRFVELMTSGRDADRDRGQPLVANRIFFPENLP